MAMDQWWSTDATDLPLPKGFLYMVAIVDLFSKNVLSWKLSNSRDSVFYLEAMEMAPGADRKPRIFHSNQACQFTSTDVADCLHNEANRISWMHRRCHQNNNPVGRLWRTEKYEKVHLRAYSVGWETEIRLTCLRWRDCHARPHSSLEAELPIRPMLEPNPAHPDRD